MSEDPNMPEVARRKGNKDTLFSADWYDDDDEFGGADKKAASSQSKATFEPESEPKGISAPVEQKGGGSNLILIVGVLMVGIVVGSGLVMVAGAIGLYLYLGTGAPM